jgi:tetratricopeptide (TPR) repeat protein
MTVKSRKQQLEEMLAIDPNDPFLLYALAMESVSAADDEAAVGSFQVMFERAPDYVPAYQQAGQALLRLGRPLEAAEVLRRGIASARKAGDSHAAEEMQGLLATIPD